MMLTFMHSRYQGWKIIRIIAMKIFAEQTEARQIKFVRKWLRGHVRIDYIIDYIIDYYLLDMQ